MTGGDKTDDEIDGRLSEAEAHIAAVRSVVAKSERLIEQYELRRAETDRLLASQGLTREEVLAFEVPEELRESVEAELRRRESATPADFDFFSAADRPPPAASGEKRGPAAGLRRLMRTVRI